MTYFSNPVKFTLAAIVVAVAGSAALVAQAQPMGGSMMGGAGMHGAHMRHGGGMPMSERMLDAVKATPEQRTQIRQIMDAARKDLDAQRETGRSLRDEQMKLFTQPNVDANAAEALRQKMLAQHDQSSKRMTQAMVDASRVLTPDQRKQLADTMSKRRDMMERHQHERRAMDAPKT
jgi:periplasmic protein CpxP/Spy